jgi:hypothetical protein
LQIANIFYLFFYICFIIYFRLFIETLLLCIFLQ